MSPDGTSLTGSPPRRRASSGGSSCRSPGCTTCATPSPRSAWRSRSAFRCRWWQRALAGFGGVHRRFERLGQFRGAEVVDDYAHHPDRGPATLAAARQVFPRRVLHAVFQPHLYSRTRDLAEEFGRALSAADHVVVTDVYPSRERPIEGVSGELVARAAQAVGHPRVDYCADWRAVPALLSGVDDGDVVLTLGAGDIYRLAEALVKGEAP